MDPYLVKPYIEKKLVNEQVHPTQGLKIYNYTNLCQIEGAWDEVTMQCRGLIVEADSGEVVARPFPKFFNLGEREHDIPSEKPHIYEKYDGSLGILYWVHEMPHIATRGSFTSDQALWATEWLQEQYRNHKGDFNREYTYLFEIIYPENRIVVNYGDKQGLVFLTAIHTETAQDYITRKEAIELPGYIDVPERHDLKLGFQTNSLEELEKLEKDNAEGFVVFFPSTGLRIKVKFEEYKRLHRIVTNVTPKSIWDALRNGDDLSEILERVPDEFYKWVISQRDMLLAEYEAKERTAKHAYEEVKDMQTRRQQADWLKQNIPQLMSIVFNMLDGKDYSQLIWKMIKPKANNSFTKEI